MKINVQDVASVVLLLLSSFMVYYRVAGYGYIVFDDPVYVTQNLMVRGGLTFSGIHWAFTTFYSGMWIPLTWISHMLDVTLFGPNAGAFHCMNVFIHTMNGVLVYCISVILIKDRLSSAFIALIFVIHAQHVESVVWISERKDVLCAFFYLLAITGYLRYTENGGILNYMIVIIFQSFALLAKPMAVSIPVVFLLMDCFLLGRYRFGKGFFYDKNRFVIIEKLPFIALTIVVIFLTLIAARNSTDPISEISMQFRLMNAALSYSTYLQDMIVPTRLGLFYPIWEPYEIDTWKDFFPSMVVLVTFTLIALIFRKKLPWVLFGWLWFLVTLLPVIGLVQIGGMSHADRFMYVPSIGILLAIGSIIARLRKRVASWTTIMISFLLVFHGVLGWIQVGYWSGPHMLWSRALEVGGSSVPAHVGLLTYFSDIGQLDKARKHAVEVIRLQPMHEQGFHSLGMVYLRMGDLNRAENMLRVALDKSPGNVNILNNIGLLLEKQGREDDALDAYRRVVEIDPNFAKAVLNLKRISDK